MRYRFVGMTMGLAATLFALLYPAWCATADGPTAQSFGLNLPEGYTLMYHQDFEDRSAFEDFEMTDPKTWRLRRIPERNSTVLENFEHVGDYTPRVRSPHNIALMTKMKFGDFILEVDVESTAVEKGAHRDTCYFFGVKDPGNFYYIHVATAADPNAHNIFRVNDAPRTNIAEHTTDGVEWGVGVWHRVRIERTLEDGMIRIFFDDMETPIMWTKDDHFDYGFIGLGSFDDTCRFDNLHIWAPGSAPERQGFFR